jgi:hypothetical protein
VDARRGRDDAVVAAAVNGDLIVAAGFSAAARAAAVGRDRRGVVWRSPSVMEQFSNTSPAVGRGTGGRRRERRHYYAFDAATGRAALGLRPPTASCTWRRRDRGRRVYMAGGGKS